MYRELITDNIWAYQRNNYGYRNLRSFPLLVEFSGLPYIDIRVSFNSFVPESLSEELAEKLINFYIKKLQQNPHLHDKVEFDIVLSCFTLDLDEKLHELSGHNFSVSEINELRSALLSLTNKIINPKDGLMISDAQRIEKLKLRREQIIKSKLPNLQKIYWLIEDCKRYGTLPFAGLARAGFIAVQLLNSLEAKKIISSSEKQQFLQSIKTVSSTMASDLKLLPINDFINLYGHLRPGTYDITSARYDKNPELYFSGATAVHRVESKSDYKISVEQLKRINLILKDLKLEVDAIELFTFIESAIILREESKFEFTKNLSEVLSIIETIGENENIPINDLAYSNINTFINTYSSTEDFAEKLNESIKLGKNNSIPQKEIILPPLILDEIDVWQFMVPSTQPNFITDQVVVAEISLADEPSDISGKIVCIQSADPGFDWIFSYDIAGFVTAWGGVNSHMAIRASEMNVPAIIGAGETVYNDISNAQTVRLDCGEKRFEVLN